eukprot:Gb_05430 [translate_table: standard]
MDLSNDGFYPHSSKQSTRNCPQHNRRPLNPQPFYAFVSMKEREITNKTTLELAHNVYFQVGKALGGTIRFKGTIWIRCIAYIFDSNRSLKGRITPYNAFDDLFYKGPLRQEDDTTLQI